MNIEFVEPPRPSRAAWIVAASLWVLVAVLAGVHVYLQARITRMQEAQRAAEEQARAPIAVASPRAVPPYQAEALEALKRAALPEAAAFAELENVAVVGVRVMSIDDNPGASTVTVELEATSDAVLMDYIDQLNAGLPAPKWHIRQISALDSHPASPATASGAGAVDVFTRNATIYRDF